MFFVYDIKGLPASGFFMKERREIETRVYSPQEAIDKIFLILNIGIPAKSFCRKNAFRNLPIPIVDGNQNFGETATLICRGIYFRNNKRSPAIIALGEINDPVQLSEKGDTLIFVRPDRYPPEEKTSDEYLIKNLTPVAYEHDPRHLHSNLEFERLKTLGLIIGRGRYNRFADFVSGGFVSVDKIPENNTWPHDKKTWSRRITEKGEITDGFILTLAQEIGKEIGIEVTSP